MKTAKQNIARLPAWCYSVLNTDKSLIIIHAGESGFTRVTNLYPTPEEVMKDLGFESMDDFADDLNKERGISKAERAAMDIGSMFGWGGGGGADVDNYTEEGKYKKSET